MGNARIAIFAVTSVIYWFLAAFGILTMLIGTCGMGPDAVCSNGGLMPALLAALGFTLVYVASTLWFVRLGAKRGN